MIDITVAIISYNAEEFIGSLLNSLASVEDPRFKTLLVDDASTDSTVDIVRCNYPQVEIAVNPSNLGHSAACNRAIELCRTRYLVLLDHDTIVSRDFLSPLMYIITRGASSIAAVTSCVIDYQGRRQYHMGFHYLVSSMPQNDRPTDPVPISQIAATTSVLIDLERAGSLRFDENFFIYNNDLDYFYRMRLCGLDIAAAPDSTVTHLTGTTELSNRGGRTYSPNRAFYNMRNRLFFFFKNYELRTLMILAPMLLLHELASVLVYAAKGFWGIFPHIARSLVSNLHHLCAERGRIQQMRCVGDGLLLSAGPYDIQEDVLSGKVMLSLKRTADWLFIAYFRMAKLLLNHRRN